MSNSAPSANVTASTVISLPTPSDRSKRKLSAKRLSRRWLADAAPRVGAAPQVSSAAATCTRVFGLVPSGEPHLDVALGFTNGSTNNAPLSARDSSGLSRAELWYEVQASDGHVLLVDVNADAGTFAAASGGNFTGAAAVTKYLNTSDETQHWTKEQIGDFARYKASNGKYLTKIAGNSAKPYQLYSSGAGGDQYFRIVLGGCL